MAKGFYKDIVKILREQGYERSKGGKGSHEKWMHPRSGLILIVPHNLLSKHTANNILKSAGLEPKF